MQQAIIKMKKIIYTLLCLAMGYQIGFAQCTANTYSGNHGYILPDSSQFPHAKQNHAFNAVIQLQVAHDTVTALGTFIFDSIFITSVNTLPALPNGAKIHYTCSVPRCSFLGASTGCINVHVDSMGLTNVATYRIIVNATAKGSLVTVLGTVPNQSQSATINWYKIIVDGNNSGILSVDNPNTSIFSVLDISPNPAMDKASVQFYSPKSATIKMSLLDVIGRKVLAENVAATNGINKTELNISTLQNGIYFVNFEVDGRNFSKKLIVQH